MFCNANCCSKVAVKKMNLDSENNIVTEESLVCEVNIMRKCRSAHIVEYMDSYQLGTEVWVRIRLCPKGTEILRL